MIAVVQFIALFLTALSMSVHFGTWLTERPLRRTQSGALFVEVHKWLGRRSERGRMSWRRLQALVEYHGLERPRITEVRRRQLELAAC